MIQNSELLVREQNNFSRQNRDRERSLAPVFPLLYKLWCGLAWRAGPGHRHTSSNRSMGVLPCEVNLKAHCLSFCLTPKPSERLLETALLLVLAQCHQRIRWDFSKPSPLWQGAMPLGVGDPLKKSG